MSGPYPDCPIGAGVTDWASVVAYTPSSLLELKSLMPPMPPVTKALLLAIVGMFCLSELTKPQLQFWLALWPLQAGAFMPWQPVTYAFLHGDPMHLFFNAVGLSVFGAELERIWGGRRYWHLLLASVLSAAVVQLMLTAVLADPKPTVGASGALFGVLLAIGMLFPNRVIMPLFPPIPMKLKVVVVVFGSLELLQGLAGSSGAAHFAHLGGMLGAWLMMQYWRRGGRR